MNENLNKFQEKAGETFAEIKNGFKSDEGTTGFKAFVSRTKNLWLSGMAGKISIIAISLIVFSVMFDMPGAEKITDIKETNTKITNNDNSNIKETNAKTTNNDNLKVPCSNPNLKQSVINIAYQKYAMDMGQMGIGPDRFSIENIRTNAHQGPGCSCSADLAIDIGQKKVMPIRYFVERTDDGKAYITVKDLL